METINMGNGNKYERVDKVLSDIDAILEQSKENAIKKLRRYTEIMPEPEQLFATLELFSTEDYSLTFNRFYRKEKGGHKALRTEYDVDNAEDSFIPELRAYSDKTFSETELNESDGQRFGTAHHTQLCKWFSECWKAAGGENAKVHTYFAMDNGGECMDLATLEWMSENDVAKKLGYEVSDESATKAEGSEDLITAAIEKYDDFEKQLRDPKTKVTYDGDTASIILPDGTGLSMWKQDGKWY